ncbi:MAG: hypothetical protein WD844_06255 [Thermoleophilaceae bacterium]
MSGARTLAPFGRRLAEVTAVERIGAYALLCALDADGPADPAPGQFYMVAAAERWGAGADERPFLPRAFSFARAWPRPGGGAALDFLMEDVGPGTERLIALGEGEGLWLTGPLGIGFAEPEHGRPLLVGGGIGVAPLLCWQDRLGRDAEVLVGFRSAQHAEAAGLFAGEPRLATDDGSAGRHGLVTDLLAEELDTDARATVYACGPPAMLEAVRVLCAGRSVPCQLALESGMACGYGACFGCVVPTREGYVRLCVDGPVLAGAALEVVA